MIGEYNEDTRTGYWLRSVNPPTSASLLPKAHSTHWDLNDNNVLYIFHQNGLIQRSYNNTNKTDYFQLYFDPEAGLTPDYMTNTDTTENSNQRLITTHYDKVTTIPNRKNELLFVLGISKSIYHTIFPNTQDPASYTLGNSVNTLYTHNARILSLSITHDGVIISTGDEYGGITLQILQLPTSTMKGYDLLDDFERSIHKHNNDTNTTLTELLLPINDYDSYRSETFSQWSISKSPHKYKYIYRDPRSTATPILSLQWLPTVITPTPTHTKKGHNSDHDIEPITYYLISGSDDCLVHVWIVNLTLGVNRSDTVISMIPFRTLSTITTSILCMSSVVLYKNKTRILPIHPTTNTTATTTSTTTQSTPSSVPSNHSSLTPTSSASSSTSSSSSSVITVMNDYIVCAGTCTGLVYIWKFGHADLVDARKATIQTDTHTTTTVATNNTSTNSNINNNKQIKYNTYLLTKNYLCHMLQISENPIVTISLVTCPILLQYFTNAQTHTTNNTNTNNNTTTSNIVYNVSAESYQIFNDKTTLFNNTTTNINTINEYTSTSTSSTSSPPLPPVMLATCDSHGMVQIFAEQLRGDVDTTSTSGNNSDTNNAYITSSDRVLLPCLQANYHSPVISCTFKPPPISLLSAVPPSRLGQSYGQSQTPYTPTPIHHHTGVKHHQDAYVQSALTAPTTAAYQPQQHQPLPQHQQQQQGGVNVPLVEDPVLSICQYDGGELLLYSSSFLYSFYQKNNTAHLDHLAADSEGEGEDEEGQNYDLLVDRSSSAIDAFDRLATDGRGGTSGGDRSMLMTSSEMIGQATPSHRPSLKEPRPKQQQSQQEEQMQYNTGGGDKNDGRRDQEINTRQGLGSRKQAIIGSALPALSATTNTPYAYNTQEDTYTSKNINYITTDTPQPPLLPSQQQHQSSAPMPSFFASNSATTTVDFRRDNEYNDNDEDEERDMMPNQALNTTPYISTTTLNNTTATNTNTTLTKPTPTTTTTPLSALKKDGKGKERGGLNPKNTSARKPKFAADLPINSKNSDVKSSVVKGDSGSGGGGSGGKIETALGHPTLHTTQVIYIHKQIYSYV